MPHPVPAPEGTGKVAPGSTGAGRRSQEDILGVSEWGKEGRQNKGKTRPWRGQVGGSFLCHIITPFLRWVALHRVSWIQAAVLLEVKEIYPLAPSRHFLSCTGCSISHVTPMCQPISVYAFLCTDPTAGLTRKLDVIALTYSIFGATCPSSWNCPCSTFTLFHCFCKVP